jgi:hypothetical protein
MYRHENSWARGLTVRDYVHPLSDGEVRVIEAALSAYIASPAFASWRRIAKGLRYAFSAGSPPDEPEHLRAWRAEMRAAEDRRVRRHRRHAERSAH